jgi:hypothetical protein
MHTNWYHHRGGGHSSGWILENSALRIERLSPLPGNQAAASVPATPFYGGIYRFGAARDGKGKFESLFPAFSRQDPMAKYRAADWQTEVWVIPLWFVLACYLPLWLALSYFQVRRKWEKIHAALPESGSVALPLGG